MIENCSDPNLTDVCPKGTTENKSALVQVMAMCRLIDKPLPEPMLTMISDTKRRH